MTCSKWSASNAFRADERKSSFGTFERFLPRVKASFAAALAAAVFFGAVPAAVLTRRPYLQEMTSRSVLIAWRTARPVTGGIWLIGPGLPPEEPRNICDSDWKEASSVKNHAIRPDHLLPFQTYQYRICSGRQFSTGWLSFRTFPEGSNAEFSFAVLGDSGTASAAQKQIAALMAARHPDFVLHVGDVIYGGKSEADYDSKFFSIYAALAEHVPFFPSLGNHDVTDDGGRSYLENFYLPQNSPGRGRYYSFNAAQAHFDALDSNEPLNRGSAQYRWLKEDLRNSPQPVKIVYFHHPLYSGGYHEGRADLRKSLTPLFRRFHVILVFNGHDHDYERFKPIAGTTYIVTGGGGAPLYPAFELPRTADTQTVYHFMMCRVDGLKIHLDAVNNEGRIFDRDDITVSIPKN